MTLTGAQLRALFPVGVPVYLAEQNYAVPADDWVTQVFYPWFWQTRTALGLRPYTRKNACDNFSRAAAQGAQDCHALTQEKSEASEAVAVGEIWFRKDSGEQHAICVSAAEKGLAFFDPQNGGKIALSTSEIFSMSFARF